MKKLILVLVVLVLATLACGTIQPDSDSVPNEATLLKYGFVRTDSKGSDCNGTCRYYWNTSVEMLAMLDGGMVGLTFPITDEAGAEKAGRVVGQVLYTIYPDAIGDWVANAMQNYDTWASAGETSATVQGYSVGIGVDNDLVTIVVIP
jgi:hypothetical protein